MHMEVLLKQAILDDCASRVGELLLDTAVIRNRYVPLQRPGERFVINLQWFDRWRISSAAETIMLRRPEGELNLVIATTPMILLGVRYIYFRVESRL